MDKALKTRMEREASTSLRLMLEMVLERLTGKMVILEEEERDLLELGVHELIDAAAEKGRGAIRT